jgi:hypothetical protein
MNGPALGKVTVLGAHIMVVRFRANSGDGFSIALGRHWEWAFDSEVVEPACVGGDRISAVQRFAGGSPVSKGWRSRWGKATW